MVWVTLIRHAKSDWNDETLRDFDRPLAERGQKSAPLMARHLKSFWTRPGSQLEGVPPPDIALVSPARRTRDTYDLIRQNWPQCPPATMVDELYDATQEAVLHILRQLTGNPRHVAVIGHNEALGDLAAELLRAPPPEDIRRDYEKFPTAAVAVIDLECARFTDIVPNNGTLLHFMTPKRLIALKTSG